MAFDGIVTNALVLELNKLLLGARINKIYQHHNDEILIHIRNDSNNYKLLLSASSNNPRIYLSSEDFINPVKPPTFCMLLRKHLISGRIIRISQYNFDRVIHIDISSKSELGEDTVKTLLIEVMGKHSNIILIKKESYEIIDSIKRVNYHMSRVRQILPGLSYENPPNQDKINPLNSNKDDFVKNISLSEDSLSIYKFFYMNYQGISPLIAKEISYLADIDHKKSLSSLNNNHINKLYDIFEEILNFVKEGFFKPNYIEDENNNIIAFHSLDLKQFGSFEKNYDSSISKILDTSYSKKSNYDRLGQKSQGIKKVIQKRLDRSRNKLAKQKNELMISLDREKYKVYADLLSSNIHKTPKIKDSISLENYYDINMSKILIPLNSKFSLLENSQNYYKRYSKLKEAEKKLMRQIPETENEILYFENVLFSLESSLSLEDLDEIINELRDEGYLKLKLKNKKKEKKEFNPLHFLSQDGYHILVGKNNRQNEFLSLKYTHREDIWLHAQNVPGSHVLIKKEKGEIPDRTLEEAALLAAYYSKSKHSNNVAVDYTEKMNVRKIPKSKPGLVRYDKFNTIIVKPSKELINKIKKVDKI